MYFCVLTRDTNNTSKKHTNTHTPQLANILIHNTVTLKKSFHDLLQPKIIHHTSFKNGFFAF